MNSGTFGRISMRGRMTALIASAMLPLFGFLGVSVVSDYELTLNSARREVLQSAALAASRQSQIFDTSRTVLNTVRRSISSLVLGDGDCHQLLARMKSANPQFLSIGVADTNGLILCHSTLTTRETFRDQDFIGRVLASEKQDFVLSDYLVMRATNKPTIVAGIPLVDADGAKIGVVFAGLDLDYLSSRGESLSAGGQRVVAIVQPSTGRILTYYPNGTLDPNATYDQHPLLKAMRNAPSGGVTEASGVFGTDRIFGFEPIDGAETAGLMVAVGEARSTLLAPIRKRALQSVAGGSVALLLALLASWWIVEKLQLQPVRRLTQTARRIGLGDFEARSGLEAWQSPELRELGGALDGMAVRLTAGREAERAIAASEAKYRLLAENTADLITCFDADGRRIFASPACRDLFGLEPHELLAMPTEDLVHPADGPILESMMATLRSGVPVSNVQTRVIHRDGHAVWVEVSGRPAENGQIVFATRDISERRRMEEELGKANRQLAALASTDALTGLLNRRAFDQSLDQNFASSTAKGADLSLLMIDADRFKNFNDRYGHTVGDDCLRQLAEAFRSILRRPGISIARYGGEEFAVILPDASLSMAIQDAETLRQSVRALAIANATSEHGVITISIGVATLVGGRGLSSPLELVRRADAALYEAKMRGRDRIEIGLSPIANAS